MDVKKAFKILALPRLALPPLPHPQPWHSGRFDDISAEICLATLDNERAEITIFESGGYTFWENFHELRLNDNFWEKSANFGGIIYHFLE